MDMFSDHHAWSVLVDPAASAKIGMAHARMRVRRPSEDFVPEADDLRVEMIGTETDARIGGRYAWIFRPEKVEVAEGAAYLAEVAIVDPKSKRSTVLLRWITAFFAPSASPETAEKGEGAK